jgi:hypothetical protein
LCCLSFFGLHIMITPLVSFDDCSVCPSSIYRLWLPLWYLLTIVVSVPLRFTYYDYPFGIFKLFLIKKKHIRENWRDNHEWTTKRQYQLKWWTTWTHHKTVGKIKCSSSYCYTHSTVFRGCCNRIRMVCCFLGVLEFPALINLDIIDWSISLAQLSTYMFSSDL